MQRFRSNIEVRGIDRPSNPIVKRSALSNINNDKRILEKPSLPLAKRSALSNINNRPLSRIPVVAKPVSTRSTSAIIKPVNTISKSIVSRSSSYSSNLLGPIPKNVQEIDSGDFPNIFLLPEYVNDVYHYLRFSECNHELPSNFLSKQRELKPTMRSIVVDWLISVHHQFRLLAETLYLGIAIMDRFFAREVISKDKIQLVGVTAFLIASKYEEIFPPAVKDFVAICGDQYKKSDVLKMEIGILKALDFKINIPKPLEFLRRISKAGSATAAIHLMAKYLMELTLVEFECANWHPSLLAAVAFYVSNKLLSPKGEGEWDETLVFYSGYTEKSLEPHVQTMCKIILRAPKSKYSTCRIKYGSPRNNNVSKSPELESAFVYEKAGVPMPNSYH